MSGEIGGTVRAAALAAALSFGVPGLSLAQDQEPAHTPPSWDALVRCAQMSDDDASLACFREAMRTAGYAPKPGEVAAEKRRRFGLSIPQVSILRRHAKEEGQAQAAAPAQATPGAAPAESAQAEAPPPAPENENEVTVTLARVAALYDGKLLFVTTDGAIWEQTDDADVEPRPKEGMTMQIHKGTLGGYFCDASAYKSVRCKRTR